MMLFAMSAALLAGPQLGQPQGGQDIGRVKEVVIVARDNYFNPSNVVVTGGSRVRFVFRNEGRNDHEFTFDANGRHQMRNVRPGKEQSMIVTMPNGPDRIRFYDSRYREMSGTINVIAINYGGGKNQGNNKDWGDNRVGEREVVIVARDNYFSPNNVAVTGGSRVRFVFRNEGRNEHEFFFEAGGKSHQLRNVRAGREQAILMTMPDGPEKVRFYDPKYPEMNGTINIISGSYDGRNNGGLQNRNTRKITVNAFANGFKPGVIRADPGDRIELKLVNQDRQPHSIVVELDRDYIARVGTRGSDSSQTVVFVVPDRPGTYRFYDQYDRSHTGQFIINGRRY